jgi:hypothetical protein
MTLFTILLVPAASGKAQDSSQPAKAGAPGEQNHPSRIQTREVDYPGDRDAWKNFCKKISAMIYCQ